MKIAIIGPGHIGSNLATQWVKAGHEVTLAFSHNEQELHDLASQLGHNTQVMTPAAAVGANDVVVLSVPWAAINTALEQTGSLAGKIVIDTSNQFGEALGAQSALAYNQSRIPGAKLAKTFNTITAGYQAQVGDGKHGKVAMFYATDDETIKSTVEQLVTDTGFVPVYLGGTDVASFMEAPRRAGAVYGEAYTPDNAKKIADALKTDHAIASKLADELQLTS